MNDFLNKGENKRKRRETILEHIKALIIKFVMGTVMLWVVLGLFYGVGFGDILLLSVIVTGAAYVIGDLLILPRYGNTIATTADFGLAFIAILLFGGLIIEGAAAGDFPLFSASLISAAFIAVGEWFFHKYMAREVLDSDNRDQSYRQQPDVSTEVAEETDVHDLYDPERAADEKESVTENKKSPE
jgi:hypothetical protein